MYREKLGERDRERGCHGSRQTCIEKGWEREIGREGVTEVERHV